MMVTQITGRYYFRGEKMIGFANYLFFIMKCRTNIYDYLLFQDMILSMSFSLEIGSGHIYD